LPAPKSGSEWVAKDLRELNIDVLLVSAKNMLAISTAADVPNEPHPSGQS